MSDRRQSVRCHEIDHGVINAFIRPGQTVRLVNLSAGGALVEASHRLLPGRPIEIHLTSARYRISLRGRLLRCAIVGVQSSAVRYRAAVAFDDHLPWLLDSLLLDDASAPASFIRPGLRF